ncbi:MAG: type IV secretory system conjugative DNA transfer family protein [Alphaproteobacteria bacterium]|jgi:type IV secretory pathway TraG/TraD family ATPase VirD4
MVDNLPSYASRKDEHYWEHFQAVDWITHGVIYSFIAAVVLSFIAFPLGHMVSHGFSAQAWENVKAFYIYVKSHPVYFIKSYLKWMMNLAENPTQGVAIWLPALPFFTFLAGVGISYYTCPYYFGSQGMGNGRLANERDIKKMGLWNGFLVVLGSWKGRLLKMNEFLATLCVAGAGTGKTTGVIIPTIFESDNMCLIINDPKGELYPLTSGYRASLGPVFRINFAGVDKPEEGIFWPTWNPLGEGDLPPPCPGRQAYIGGLAFFLLGDGPTGTDPYWVKAGRSALEGFINYICDKCDQARANDYFLQRLYEDALDDEDLEVLETYYVSMEKTKEVRQAIENVRKGNVTLKNYLPIGKWDPIPEAWIGRQSSFPMLMDFITAMQLEVTAELRARRDAGDPVAFKTDIWAKILENTIEEAAYYGYDRRSLVELNQILALPKTQRSSVLSMALSGLAPFKNGAIRMRMASGDFVSVDQRGIKNPQTGKWEPVTFYLCGPEEAMTAAMLSMFLNMNSGTLTIFAPNEGPCGPFPLLYVLDDYQMLPNFNVVDGIGIGYAKQYSFLLACHDLSELSAKYGGAVDTIIGNTGAKIFMRMNNEETATRLDNLIEKETKVVVSTSRQEGLNVTRNPFEHNLRYGIVGDAIIGTAGMLNMPFGTQYALIQKNYFHPIKLKTPFYFNDRKMVRKSKMPAAPFLPPAIYEARNEEDKLPPEEMAVEHSYEASTRLADRGY